MKYDAFRNIVKKTDYYLEPSNNYSKEDRKYKSTNDLIKPNNSKSATNYYYPYAIGIKTGYTKEAKNCLVSAANKDGLDLFCVILGGEKMPKELIKDFLKPKIIYFCL